MFVIFLTPFLVEIILVEIYLMLGRRIKLDLMILLKVTALGLAIVNLCVFSSCQGYTRTVSANTGYQSLTLLSPDIGILSSPHLDLLLLCHQYKPSHWDGDPHLYQGRTTRIIRAK